MAKGNGDVASGWWPYSLGESSVIPLGAGKGGTYGRGLTSSLGRGTGHRAEALCVSGSQPRSGWWRGNWVPAPWYVGVRIGEAGHPGPERERHKGRKRKLTPEQSFKKQLALKKERAKAKLRRYQDNMKKLKKYKES